jgi:hypothetical protein
VVQKTKLGLQFEPDYCKFRCVLQLKLKQPTAAQSLLGWVMPISRDCANVEAELLHKSPSSLWQMDQKSTANRWLYDVEAAFARTKRSNLRCDHCSQQDQ